ncbi:MAG: hypothetical protein AAGK03_19415 [Pseudomonadota bacterium]
MIKNGKFFVEPRQSTDNFKVLFGRLAAQGAGRPVDRHEVADGPWTPETLADAITAIDSNNAGIDVRTVQVWFQANDNGISDKNIRWLARIFGCNDPVETSRWQSELKAAKERLAAERRARRRVTAEPIREASGRVQGQTTRAIESPDEVEAPSDQQKPEHHRISLAARAESLFLDGAPFGMVVTMWAGVAVLLYIGYLLGAHDVTYSPVQNVEKQVGLFWSPNWLLDKLVWLPLIVFTVSTLVTSWKEQWRPLMVAESSDPTQSCNWSEKLAVYSSSFVGITLVCFCIVFLLQWYGSYLKPLMQNDAGSRVIDWLLISIERPDVLSANQGMAASMYANLLSGIAYWYCFSGLMLLYIASMDFKEISGRVSFGQNTIKSLEILQIADAIVSGIFRCAVFALLASIGIKLVAVYLMTDSENIVRWLVLDASALMNGHDGSWTWFDKNPSASITSFFVMFIPVFVFFLCASQIRGSVRSLLIAEQAGNRGSIGPVGAATKKMMINWLSRASVILLLVVNFWLIGRFTGFSVLLLSSCCLAVFCVVASQGSHPSTDIPRNEELLGVQGK